MDEFEVLKFVSAFLNKQKIPYMISGSMALAYYAQPRMTRDIDIVIDLLSEDIETVVKGFQERFYLSEESIKDAVQTQFMFNIIDLQSGIKVDFIVKKKDEFRKVEFSRRLKINYNGAEIYIVSLEDLILSKLYWARDSESEMQLRDVKNLLGSNYDEDYLHTWLDRLNLNELFKKCQN